MNALISGQTGTACFIEGNTVFVVDVDSPQVEKLYSYSSIPYLLAGATDIIEFNMNTQIEISQMFENLSEDRSWSFEELTRKDTSYATHGFHRYPATQYTRLVTPKKGLEVVRKTLGKVTIVSK